MERITSNELGFILCAIDSAIHHCSIIENDSPISLERSFAHLRKEQFQSVYSRLYKAYKDENKRIAVQV